MNQFEKMNTNLKKFEFYQSKIGQQEIKEILKIIIKIVEFSDAVIDNCFKKEDFIPKITNEKEKLASKYFKNLTNLNNFLILFYFLAIQDFSPANVTIINQILKRISESQESIIREIKNRNDTSN